MVCVLLDSSDDFPSSSVPADKANSFTGLTFIPFTLCSHACSLRILLRLFPFDDWRECELLFKADPYEDLVILRLESSVII
jgi:hypothetical protein